MGDNPFNRGTFQEAQDQQRAFLEEVHQASKARQVRDKLQADEHNQRLVDCLLDKRRDPRFYPSMVVERMQEEADAEFRYILEFSELLEIPPVDYLRALGAWQRRKYPEHSKPRVKAPTKPRPLAGLGPVSIGAGILVIYLGIRGVMAGPGGLLLLPVLVGMWGGGLWLHRAYFSSGDWGGSRGPSGNAV